MEIVNDRWKMLDAMESNAKGNDNFAIKVIIIENVKGKSSIKKNRKGVRRKSQTYLFPFSKLLLWTTSLKVSCSGKVLFLKFWTLINKE